MPADAGRVLCRACSQTTRTAAWQSYLKDNQFQDAFLAPEATRKFLNRVRGAAARAADGGGRQVVR